MSEPLPFEARYPSLAMWIRDHGGWIEIGGDGTSRSLVRVLNPGGMVWESGAAYTSIDEALAEADRAVVLAAH
ncbi:hypothetical protein [Methylomagnum sp.]